jgi:hypothetical protein
LRQAQGFSPGGGDLSVFESGFHFPHRPAFPSGYHAHLSAPVDQGVRADLVVDRDDRELGLRLPVEREVEVAREYTDNQSPDIAGSTTLAAVIKFVVCRQCACWSAL